jgi:hypothetical protein
METVVRHKLSPVGQLTGFVHHRFLSDEHITIQAYIRNQLLATFLMAILLTVPQTFSAFFEKCPSIPSLV